MLENTTMLNARYTGLNMNVYKTKNHEDKCKTRTMTSKKMEVEEVQTFGTTMNNCDTGGTEADKKKRLGLDRIAFLSLNNLWKSARYSTKT